MKGVVYNLLEECVVDEHGEAAWDGLLADAGVDGVYASVGSYPDEELLALVDAASRAFATPPDEVVRWLGRCSIPRLAERYPELFAAFGDLRSFLMSLNAVIHPEVRKLYPGALAPEFEYAVGPGGELLLRYRSPRKLCLFAEGLVLGSAHHFGESVAVDQPCCARRGDQHCELRIVPA